MQSGKITHGKEEKQFLFEVQLNWLSAKRGILTSDDVKDTIHVSTPPEFGGEGQEWSPEHLFLSSISSCFMSTFLLFASKLHCEISRFECNTIGHIQLVDGKYKFTTINVYPKILLVNEADFSKAKLADEKTRKYCLVSNSINADIHYHTQILKDPYPRHLSEATII